MNRLSVSSSSSEDSDSTCSSSSSHWPEIESPGEALWKACKRRDFQEVKGLIERNPGLDVNWFSGQMGFTRPLFEACMRQDLDTMKLLLAHPAINVNAVNDDYGSVLMIAIHSHPVFLRLLLSDPRVRVNDMYEGTTAISASVSSGDIGSVKWLIASGKDLDIGTGQGYDTTSLPWMSASEQAGKSEAISLLSRFVENPLKTRHEVRMELGAFAELARLMFALVVFLCDNFLALRKDADKALPATRFFRMVQQLSMELQMVVCRRSAGSMEDDISMRDSDAGFKEAARLFA